MKEWRIFLPRLSAMELASIRRYGGGASSSSASSTTTAAADSWIDDKVKPLLAEYLEALAGVDAAFVLTDPEVRTDTYIVGFSHLGVKHRVRL